MTTNPLYLAPRRHEYRGLAVIVNVSSLKHSCNVSVGRIVLNTLVCGAWEHTHIFSHRYLHPLRSPSGTTTPPIDRQINQLGENNPAGTGHFSF